MKAFEAYNYVLSEYNIKARDIAEATGKSETDISKFRNGHRTVSADLLQQFILALPMEARAHFNMLYSYLAVIKNNQDNFKEKLAEIVGTQKAQIWPLITLLAGTLISITIATDISRPWLRTRGRVLYFRAK